jgi:cation transport regulator ChaC
MVAGRVKIAKELRQHWSTAGAGRPSVAKHRRGQQTFVFGYGSLVSTESIESTLRRGIDRSTFEYAQLRGWKRAWNVGSDKQSHPERTFRLEDGSEFDGLTVVLGIERSGSGHRCDGSVFCVTRQDLNLLDVRERNYERIEVTDLISWAGKPDNRVVYTYCPRAVAVAKIDDAKASHRPINVRKGYKELVETAFDQIGRLDSYRRTTPGIPFKIQEMDSIVDPSLLPAALRRPKPSEAVPRSRSAADDTGPVDEVAAHEGA